MNQSLTHPGAAGARNGLKLSVWLTVMYFASVFSADAPFLGLLSMAIMAGVPFIMWRLLAADFRASSGRLSMGRLWLDGLVTVMCGSVIAGTLLLAYLRWIDPTYIYDRWSAGMAAFEASGDPALEQMARDMQTAIDNGFSISPSMLTMSMLWFAAFSGSLLSLVLAAIVRASKSALLSQKS